MIKAHHIVVVSIMVLLTGCLTIPQPRMTHETVVNGKIVVEWPRPVKAVEVDTVEVEGRALSVAPMPVLKLVEP